MDAIFNDFKEAFLNGDGYKLSMTLSPVAPAEQPDRLRAFHRSTNFASVKQDFQYRIRWDKSNGFQLEADEGNGWVEVYVAYWKAIDEVLKAEEATRTNTKVFVFPSFGSSGDCYITTPGSWTEKVSRDLRRHSTNL